MNLDLTTSAGLTAAVAVLLTAITVIVPGLRTWFEAKSGDEQRAIRGVIVLALAVAFVGGACAGFLPGPACNVRSIGDYFVAVVLAAVISLGSSDGIFLAARVRATSVKRRAFFAQADGYRIWVNSPHRKLLG